MNHIYSLLMKRRKYGKSGLEWPIKNLQITTDLVNQCGGCGSVVYGVPSEIWVPQFDSVISTFK